MELDHRMKYHELTINGVYFKLVQVFILNDVVEIVDSWSGLTIAKVCKDDVSTIEIS